MWKTNSWAPTWVQDNVHCPKGSVLIRAVYFSLLAISFACERNIVRPSFPPPATEMFVLGHTDIDSALKLLAGEYISADFARWFLQTRSPAQAASIEIPWLTWIRTTDDCAVDVSMGTLDYGLDHLHIKPDGTMVTDSKHLAAFPFAFETEGKYGFAITAGGYPPIQYLYVNSLCRWINGWLLRDVRYTSDGLPCLLERDGRLRLGGALYSIKPILDKPFDGFYLDDCPYMSTVTGQVIKFTSIPEEEHRFEFTIH